MRHLLQPLLEHPLAVFYLTLLWLLLQGHLAPGQILLGIALAVVVTKISSHFWTDSQPRPAFVELPLALKDPFARYLLATTISLSPGSLSAAFSADRRLLLPHLLDTPDEDAAAAECARIKDRYESLLREIFP